MLPVRSAIKTAIDGVVFTDFPDLAPADFFPFPSWKATIKGVRYADVNAKKDRVTAVLRSIPQEAFSDCFRKL